MGLEYPQSCINLLKNGRTLVRVVPRSESLFMFDSGEEKIRRLERARTFTTREYLES